MSGDGQMLTAAVVGYASLDHAARTGPFRGPGATTEVRQRLSEPWPSPGGITHFVSELARQRTAVHAVTWVGRDRGGGEFLASLKRLGAGVEGVDRSAARSPTCHLYYPPGQATVVFFDPGDCPTTLSAPQRAVVRAADWVCLSVAPADALQDVLDVLPPRSGLLWSVKADPLAVTDGLTRRLAERADIITYSHTEHDFLHNRCGLALTPAAKSNQLVIETLGADGARYWCAGSAGKVACERLDVADTTGAGDTFAAAVLAATMHAGQRGRTAVSTHDAAQVIESATDAATTLLRRRQR